MTTSNIQLPDGQLLSITGDDAKAVANYLKQELTRDPVFSNTEAPLKLPVLNFEARTHHASDRIVRSVPTPKTETNTEIPLEVPTMNFDESCSAKKRQPRR